MSEKLAKLDAIIERKKALRDTHQFNFDAFEQQQKEIRMQIDELNNKIVELEAEKGKIIPMLDIYKAEVAELEDARAEIIIEDKPVEVVAEAPVVEPVVEAQPSALTL